jgi:hypothetical protein
MFITSDVFVIAAAPDTTEPLVGKGSASKGSVADIISVGITKYIYFLKDLIFFPYIK